MAAPPPKKKSNAIVVVVVVIAALALLVPCVGVLAAVAIPAFLGYTQRSKSAEATSQLAQLHAAAASYYALEHATPSGEILTHCAVASARTPNPPSREATIVTIPEGSSFDAIGFSLADPVRYQYEIVSPGGCGHAPNESLYTFRAYGDLDGDGVQSVFELTSVSDAANELVRQPTEIRSENELE